MTEQEIVEKVLGNEVAFRPLELVWRQRSDALAHELLLEARWQDGLQLSFLADIKAQSTPLVLQNALRRVLERAQGSGLYPLVVVPYLSEANLNELEKKGISGLDLCGNGIIVVPQKTILMRTGNANRFPASAAIKNIYRKRSSMVVRACCAKSQFESLSGLMEEISARDIWTTLQKTAMLSLGTVSKVVSGLREDLVVSEKPDIRVIQPEKLLEKMNDNYEPVSRENRIERKVDCSLDQLASRLADVSRELKIPLVATGLSSAMRYTSMQRGDMICVYCPSPEKILASLRLCNSHQFPNLQIFASSNEWLYFDARADTNGFAWASPVQTWLELMQGDKRDQEMAEQVRKSILTTLGAKK
jgi:hypothetical protein